MDFPHVHLCVVATCERLPATLLRASIRHQILVLHVQQQVTWDLASLVLRDPQRNVAHRAKVGAIFLVPESRCMPIAITGPLLPTLVDGCRVSSELVNSDFADLLWRVLTALLGTWASGLSRRRFAKRMEYAELKHARLTLLLAWSLTRLQLTGHDHPALQKRCLRLQKPLSSRPLSVVPIC